MGVGVVKHKNNTFTTMQFFTDGIHVDGPAQYESAPVFASPLSVASGGTGSNSFGSGYIPYYNGTALANSLLSYVGDTSWGVGKKAKFGIGDSSIFGITTDYTTGTMIFSVYKSGGNGQLGPNSFDALTIASNTGVISLASPLPVSSGGTGASSFTSGYIPYYNGSAFVDSLLSYVGDTSWGVGKKAKFGIGDSSVFGITTVYTTASMIFSVFKSGGNGQLGPNSLDALTIAGSSGNIGIGTSDPTEKLDVAGNIKVSGKTIFGSGAYAGGFAQAYTQEAHGLTITGKTGTTNDFLLANGVGTKILEVPTGTVNANFSGNVGIGGIGAVPEVRLNIQGGLSGVRIDQTGSVNTSYSFLQFCTNTHNVSTFEGLEIGLKDSDGMAYISRKTHSGFVASESLAFDENANLGIGIVPAEKLHVNGSIRSTGLTIYSTSPMLLFYNHGIKEWLIGQLGTVTGAFSIKGAGDSDAITILTNNNVGIGTSSPESKLHIKQTNDTSYYNPGLKVQYSGGSQAATFGVGTGGYARLHSTTALEIISEGEDPSNHIHFMTGHPSALHTRLMINAATGNVGIGTTAPTEKLDVVGNIKAAGMVYPSASNTYSLGKASNLWSEVFAANGTINTSDAREKTDVRQFTADELNAAKLLANEIGLFKFLSSIALKGEAARTHVGMTVQRAIEIMQSCNLDPFAYGFICYDEWDQRVIEHPEIPARPEIPAQEFIPAVIDPETGNIISAEVPAVEYSPAVEAVPAWTEVLTEAGNRYGFRYDQLTLFMAKGFYQMSVDAISGLQAQIDALKSV